MISSIGRRRIQNEIDSLNLNDLVAARIPKYRDCTETGCGFDEESRAAKDISCPVCLGKGRVATWIGTYVRGRVSWTDVGRPRFGGAVTTDELGDVTFTTKQVYQPLLEVVRDTENAFLEIDGKKLRVISVDPNRIEGKTSVVSRCKLMRD
jgi:hypothetical protein